MSAARIEALAQADAYLTNAGMPSYSDLVALLMRTSRLASDCACRADFTEADAVSVQIDAAYRAWLPAAPRDAIRKTWDREALGS